MIVLSLDNVHRRRETLAFVFEMNRTVPQQAFRASRQMHWRRMTRQSAIKESRKRRDIETKRMEQYRRLCEREGIVSRRLAEYDDMKKKNSDLLQHALDTVQGDESLTGAQKRRKKFSLKQKAAAMSTATKEFKAGTNPIARVQRIASVEQKEKELTAEAQKKEKDARKARRATRQQAYTAKTRKGQPLMSAHLKALLTKIES